jgi:hypothetical protein
MTKQPSSNDLPIPLEDAISRISNLAAPTDAVNRLIDSASSEQSVTSQRIDIASRGTSRRSLLRWAVAASIAASALLAVSLWPNSSNNASANNLFANMNQIMSEVKTIEFVSRIVLADGTVQEKMHGFANEENCIRQENDDLVVILDFEKRKMFQLRLAQKLAKVHSLGRADSTEIFISAVFAVIRGEDPGNAQWVGEHVIEGIQVVEYEVKMEDAVANIFIEVDTSRPVKVVQYFGDVGAEHGDVRAEVSDFVFDEPFDESLFEFNVPDGFELQVIEDPGPIHDAGLVMESGAGLGPVEFGFTMAQVIEQFGQPTTISVGKDVGPFENDVLFYQSRGFQLQVHPTHGVVIIAATNASLMGGNEKFTGQYAGGIRIGDGMEEVVEILGQPTRKEGESYIYDSEVAGSNASFKFKDGKVNSMSVMRLP